MLAKRYRIISLLGRGGMGEVYRADDLKLGQPVALKFLPERVARDEARLARFLNEVKVALKVTHPNVCRVYDVGEVEGQHYIAMEYVDGEDLASLLRRIGRLPKDKAVPIARQLCAGLAAAHQEGILHRDLKPANVMIDGRGRRPACDRQEWCQSGRSRLPEPRPGVQSPSSSEENRHPRGAHQGGPVRIAGSTSFLFVSLSILAALAQSALASPAAATPEPPAPLARPQVYADGWCPSGRDLDEYLEARRALPWVERRDGLRAPPPAPVVTSMGGVLVIEDGGKILRRDNILDLPMQTIEYVPSGPGYAISFLPPAYEPLTAKDSVLFADQTGWISQPFTLTRFSFPFGGTNRTDLWITSTNLVSFAAPNAPVKIGLCTTGCYYDEGQTLLDRLPRLSPLQFGATFYGQNAWIRQERDHVVITWRFANPANMDLQAVLYSDGRIRFNYAAISGILHGVPVVITGNDAFWSDRRLGGDATDPAGDLPIPAPDGPAMDIVSASARQIGTSEILQVEVTLASPPPPANEKRLFYQFTLKDDPLDPEPIGSILLQYQNGQFYWMTEPTQLAGSTLRFNLRLLNLPISDNDLHLTFVTFRGDAPYDQGDRVEMVATFAPPTGPMMLDLTDDLPVTRGGEPLYEAFTMPSLEVGEVLKVVGPLFEDPKTVEAFPIYQNLWTDIWFFAGGYHAGGNAGVDGIGFGSSALPRSPSLLHVNNIYNYSEEQNTMLVLSHEFGHRWLYHFQIMESGQPTNSLNPAGGHPAGWVHTPAVQPVYLPFDYGLMGGSWWRDNGNGTFTSATAAEGSAAGFSWHEMYLLGLAPPGEVADWWYIRNPIPSLPSQYWPDPGTTVLGERVPVTVQQILDVEGPRFPAYPESPTSFLAPIVLVVRPGEYTAEEIQTTADICNVWTTRFPQSTFGRGSVRCLFAPPVVTITSPLSDPTVFPGATIEFAGSASDEDGDAVTMRWDFSGAAPDATGPGPHPVTFTSSGSYPVTLDGVDASGMLARPPDTRLVTVECPTSYPSEVVSGLRLGKEGGDLRFTWEDLASWTGDYVVLASDSAQGPFYPQAGASSGNPGLVLAAPAGNAFYKVAARNASGCLGPY